uniref:Uncharacterized protein n=1 Tax=Myoviridae sp. ctJ2i1 TaxID=2825079 RepID=A0A8S5V1Z2_9CAUD|nr:MAG TPA: hypothetical protein [Myoviridae sp. ctJ2i1]
MIQVFNVDLQPSQHSALVAILTQISSKVGSALIKLREHVNGGYVAE